MTGEQRHALHKLLAVGAYLLLATLVCILVVQLCAVTAPVVDASVGHIDLTGADFASGNITIRNTSFSLYPGVFYEPGSFDDGTAPEAPTSYGQGISLGTHGTVRLTVALPPGEVYAITAKSMSYAQRLFIDGVEHSAIGTPGDSFETTSPRTTRYVAAFAPAGEVTEIVIHYAAFAYADTGGLYTFQIGHVEHIARAEGLRAFRTAAITAALAVATLFFIGLFLLAPGNRHLLWFALCCCCTGLRGLLTDDKIIMVLLPELSWYVAIRMEFIAVLGMALFAGLYLDGLFPLAKRWMIRTYTAFCLCAMSLVLFTDPAYFSRYIERIVWVCAACVVALLVAVFIAAVRGRLASSLPGEERLLLIGGFGVYLALSVWNIYAHGRGLVVFELDYAQVAVVVFLLLNMLTLAMGFSRSQQELDIVRRSEAEIRETNALLQRLDRAKTQFLADISHEMKTPLAVMSSAAGLTLTQLRTGQTDAETEQNLDAIQREAVRLGRLVEGLMEVSVERERRLTLSDTDAETVLRRAAEFCAPICRGRGNHIAVSVPPEAIPLRVQPESIFRVLVNLITNANRQMENSEITLAAATGPSSGTAVLTVTDTGGGIPPGLMDTLFDRGVSGDGGAGLGLAICREIVEEHGGTITAENTQSGARFTVALPHPEGGKSDGA